MRFYLHPLFFIFGIYYAFIGKIFLFLTYTLSALLHELGHAISAGKRGYALKRLSLMPYGATIIGDFDGLSAKDELIIALSGPFTSFCIALIFVASWWVFPDLYPVTEVAYTANLSLALINLLPAKPLDGGRILTSLTAILFKKKVGEIATKFLGVAISLAMAFTFFMLLWEGESNFSLLIFSLIILCGCFSSSKNSAYARIYIGLKESDFKRGVNIKRFAVSVDIKIKRLISLLDATSYNEVSVFKNLKKIAVLSEEELSIISLSSNIDDMLGDVLKKLK